MHEEENTNTNNDKDKDSSAASRRPIPRQRLHCLPLMAETTASEVLVLAAN